MIQHEIVEALLSLMPVASFSVEGDGYDTIVWIDDSHIKPTEQEVEAEIIRLRENAAAEEIARVEQELAKQNAKASALAKLSALGLTPEEIEAIIGV